MISAQPARAFGYLPDRFDARDLDLRVLLERASPLARRASPNLRAFRRHRLLQGSAGACFAFACARSIHMSLLLQTPPTDPEPAIPSPAFIYWNARAQEWNATTVEHRPRRLEDTGTRPRHGMEAVRALGFAPWAAAPYDPRHIFERPPREAYMRAFDQRNLRYYRIGGFGMARVEACRAALLASAPVIVCMKVDEPFLWNTGELVRSIDNQRLVGGHAMTLLDLTDAEAVVDNWWDEWGTSDPAGDWNQGGLGRLSLDVLGGPHVSDVYALVAAPLYSEGEEL